MLKDKSINVDSALIFLPGVKLFIGLDNKIISAMAERMCMFKFDADLLVKEIHQILKVHHANYEVETIDRVSPDLDFTLE